MMHSSTVAGSMPARLTASRTTSAPSCGAVSSFSAPRNLPVGVRTAETMTEFIVVYRGLVVRGLAGSDGAPGCGEPNPRAPRPREPATTMHYLNLYDALAPEQLLHPLQDRVAGALDLLHPAWIPRADRQHRSRQRRRRRARERRPDRDRPRKGSARRRRRLALDDFGEHPRREVLQRHHASSVLSKRCSWSWPRLHRGAPSS